MKKLGHKSHFQESINVGVSWTVPMCVTRTLSALGKCTKDDKELVMLVKRDIEWMMWSMAPVSRTQVSALWAILFEGFSEKIEFFKLMQTES